MPRSPSTYSLPPGTTPQVPNTVISSSMFTAFADDVAQTFNTIQPIVYGGTGSNDLKLTDTEFGIKDNGDPTKIGQFNASSLPTATTRTYDLPYYSGTLGLVSDIRGQIFGLTTGNNLTDPTNDIDFAAGSAVDSTGTASMLLASGLTKRADAAWAAGTNQGGRFHATLADGTLNYYIIRNPTTGVVDCGFSDNATNPTGGANYPSGFTQYRYIGAIVRSGGTILPYYQSVADPDKFRWVSPPQDVNAVNPGTSANTRNLSVPQGRELSADILVGIQNATNSIIAVIVSPLAVADITPTNTLYNLIGVASTSYRAQVALSIPTNTAGQIRSRISASGASDTLLIVTLGWTDHRGRFS